MYLPGTLPLCDPAVATWAGESGRRYDFVVVRPSTAWLDEPAVFILAKRDGGRDKALYIGQTGSLQRSFGASALCPDVWSRALALGMTHLHLRFEACSVAVRRTEVRDLVAAQQPVLNEELRHEASAPAMASAATPVAAWAPPRPLIPAGHDLSPSRRALDDGAMPLQALGRLGVRPEVVVRPARPPRPRPPRDLAPPSPGLIRGTLRADPARGEEPDHEPLMLLPAAAPEPVDVESLAFVAVDDPADLTHAPSAIASPPEPTAPEVVTEPDPSPEIASVAELAPAPMVAPLPPLAPGWTVDTGACSTVADAFPAVADAKATETPPRRPGLLGRLRRVVVERTRRLWRGDRPTAVTPDEAGEAPSPVVAGSADAAPPIIEAPATTAAEPIWLTPVTGDADAGEAGPSSVSPAEAPVFDEAATGAYHVSGTAAAEPEEQKQPETAAAEAEAPAAADPSIEETVIAVTGERPAAEIPIAEAASPAAPTESAPAPVAESAGATTDDAAKRALDLDPTAPCLLFASELSYAAGADILIDALRVVCVDDLRLQVVVAGDGPMRADLHDRAQSAGLAQRCRFLGDVPPTQFAAVLAACDFVVIPARERQSPDLATLALSHGKPVLATQQAGIAAIVHGLNGLVTYDNPGSFVWGIRELLGPLYRDLRRHLAEAA